jgi:hypothetical protein
VLARLALREVHAGLAHTDYDPTPAGEF